MPSVWQELGWGPFFIGTGSLLSLGVKLTSFIHLHRDLGPQRELQPPIYDLNAQIVGHQLPLITITVIASSSIVPSCVSRSHVSNIRAIEESSEAYPKEAWKARGRTGWGSLSRHVSDATARYTQDFLTAEELAVIVANKLQLLRTGLTSGAM